MGCTIDGCTNTHHGKGLCSTHHKKWRAGLLDYTPPARPCTVDGCTARHYAKGLCRPHYQAAWDAANRPKTEPKPAPEPCSNGCQRPAHARGLCRACYRRQEHQYAHQVRAVDWLWIPAEPTPCYGRAAVWESSRPADVAEAAAGCAACRFSVECDGYAAQIRPQAGVWAGKQWQQGWPRRVMADAP